MIHQEQGSRQQKAYEMRRWLWHNSKDRLSRGCLRFADGEHGARVVLAGGDGRAAYRGVQRCARVWICPTCSRAIAGRRAKAISVAWGLIEDPVMVTLTIKHEWGESLPAVLGRVQDAWRKVRTGKGAWAGEYVRVLEVTTGRRGGWHPHFHVLTSRSGAQALIDRWVLKSGASPDACKISETDESGVGEYLAGEMLGSHYKGRSQWALLARAVDGDDRAAWLWEQFEDGIKGARQVTWSRKLRAAVSDVLGAPADASDESIVEEMDMGETKDVAVVFVDPVPYARLVVRGDLGHVLTLVDERRFADLDDYLDEKTGGGYRLVPWAQMLAERQRARVADNERQGDLW